MSFRSTRRQALQAAVATGVATSLPPFTTAAHSATPAAVADGTFGAGQVQAALAPLDSLIEDAMVRMGVPGAAVAVVFDDEVVYERAFGVREVGKPEPVTPETVFQLASLSKAISSTVVAGVVSDGATFWDAVAADILPGFALADPWWTAQVTLRDFFAHRSGLPAYAGDSLTATFGYGRNESVHRMRFIQPASSLRSAFAYTNLGLSAAAYAAAEAAGQSWEDLAGKRLFEPLGMTSTSYRLADYLNQANRAAPHYRQPNGDWALGEVTDADAAAPAGGVSSNIHDLSQWLRLQLATGVFDDVDIIAPAALLETRRPQILASSPSNPADGPASFYGLGWYLHYDERGRLVVHHIGDFNSGFRTGVSFMPEAGLGIVVLSNAWPNSLADAIPRAFFELVEFGEPSSDWIEILEEQTAAGLAAVKAAAPFPFSESPADSPPLSLDAYAGTYTNQQYGEITIRTENDGLVLELGPLPSRLSLTHWDRDVFTYPLPASAEVLLGRLGMQFLIGPDGFATTAALGLPTVGPEATSFFARVD